MHLEILYGPVSQKQIKHRLKNNASPLKAFNLWLHKYLFLFKKVWYNGNDFQEPIVKFTLSRKQLFLC